MYYSYSVNVSNSYGSEILWMGFQITLNVMCFNMYKISDCFYYVLKYINITDLYIVIHLYIPSKMF